MEVLLVWENLKNNKMNAIKSSRVPTCPCKDKDNTITQEPIQTTNPKIPHFKALRRSSTVDILLDEVSFLELNAASAWVILHTLTYRCVAVLPVRGLRSYCASYAAICSYIIIERTQLSNSFAKAHEFLPRQIIMAQK